MIKVPSCSIDYFTRITCIYKYVIDVGRQLVC